MLKPKISQANWDESVTGAPVLRVGEERCTTRAQETYGNIKWNSKCKAFSESQTLYFTSWSQSKGTMQSFSMQSLKRTTLDILNHGQSSLLGGLPKPGYQVFSVTCRPKAIQSNTLPEIQKGLKLNYFPFSHSCSLINLIPKFPENNLRLL